MGCGSSHSTGVIQPAGSAATNYRVNLPSPHGASTNVALASAMPMKPAANTLLVGGTTTTNQNDSHTNKPSPTNNTSQHIPHSPDLSRSHSTSRSGGGGGSGGGNNKRSTPIAPTSTTTIGTTTFNVSLATTTHGGHGQHGGAHNDRNYDSGGTSSRRSTGLTFSPPASARGLQHNSHHHHTSSGQHSRRPSSEMHEKVLTKENEILVSIAFFESLDKKNIRKLRDAFQRKKYAAGEWIQHPSANRKESFILKQQDAAANPLEQNAAASASPPQAASDFFVIISGNVQLSMRVKTSKTTGTLNLNHYGHGPSANLQHGQQGQYHQAPLSLRPDPFLLPQTSEEDVVLAILRDGQWFGSEILSNDEFTISGHEEDRFLKADILALSDCILLSISRESFHTFVQEQPEMRTQIGDKVSNTRISLYSIPFFSGVDELKLQQLSQLLEFRRFNAGDTIITEGEMGEGFWIIVNGHAKITIQTRNWVDPNQLNTPVLLSTLSSGDFFNETALLGSVPQVATVSAESDMLCLFLSYQRFKRFERLAPEVLSETFKKISETRTTQLLKTIPLFDVLCLNATPGNNSNGASNNKEATSNGSEPATTTAQPRASSGGRRERADSLSKNRAEMVQNESTGSAASGGFDSLPAPSNTAIAASSTSPPISRPTTASTSPSYDERKLSLLASLFMYESFSPKSIIFTEGDRADKLYILLRGTVEVSAVVESGVVVLNTLSMGDFFGEISLMFPTVRSATVTTLSPCLCLCLTADKFARFLSIAPELKERLSFAIGPRVATIIEHIPFFRNEIKENKPWSKLGLLGELCQFEKHEVNEIIFKQGDLGDKFFVIVAGAVLITKEDRESDATGGGMVHETIEEEGGIGVGNGSGPGTAVNSRRATGSARIDTTNASASGSSAPQTGYMPTRLLPSSSVGSPAEVTTTSGVILRRGNYLGEDCLIDGRVRWGTAISLSLTVFLTLTRENFNKYVRIAPELRELIMNRQQSSGSTSSNANDVTTQHDGGVSTITRGKSSKRGTAPTVPYQSSSALNQHPLQRVMTNKSLESSPIYSTPLDMKDDVSDENFAARKGTSKRMALKNPLIQRITNGNGVAMSTPTKSRQLGLGANASTMDTPPQGSSISPSSIDAESITSSLAPIKSNRNSGGTVASSSPNASNSGKLLPSLSGPSASGSGKTTLAPLTKLPPLTSVSASKDHDEMKTTNGSTTTVTNKNRNSNSKTKDEPTDPLTADEVKRKSLDVEKQELDRLPSQVEIQEAV